MYVMRHNTNKDAARGEGQERKADGRKNINYDAINIKPGCVYADPCYIIPDSLWSEYCGLGMEGFEWEPRQFRGMRFEVKRTGGDGVFFGAFVDSGTVARFPLSVLTHDFFARRQFIQCPHDEETERLAEAAEIEVEDMEPELS